MQSFHITAGWVAVGISILAAGFSLFTHYQLKAIKAYDNLDELYLSVLKIGMESPRFVDPGLTRSYKKSFSDEERLQYEQYAFIAWNICETIYDRKKDKNVLESWRPGILAQDELHRGWFDASENHGKFKEAFRSWIRKEFPH